MGTKRTARARKDSGLSIDMDDWWIDPFKIVCPAGRDRLFRLGYTTTWREGNRPAVYRHAHLSSALSAADYFFLFTIYTYIYLLSTIGIGSNICLVWLLFLDFFLFHPLVVLRLSAWPAIFPGPIIIYSRTDWASHPDTPFSCVSH